MAALAKEIAQNEIDLKKAQTELATLETTLDTKKKLLGKTEVQLKLKPKDKGLLTAKAALDKSVADLTVKARNAMLAEAKLSGEKSGLILKLNKVTAVAQSGDLAALRKLPFFTAFVKAQYLTENLNFLDKAPDRACYEMFVKAGSAQEVNLPSAMRQALDDDYREPGNRPPGPAWNNARAAIKKLLITNINQSFLNWIKANVDPAQIKA